MPLLRNSLPISITTAAVLFGTGCGRDADTTYTLRRPVTPDGRTLRIMVNSASHDGVLTIDRRGSAESGTMKTNRTRVIEHTKADGASSTRVEVLQNDFKTTLNWAGEEKVTEQASTLIGNPMILEQVGGRWELELEEGGPSREQEVEIAELAAYENRAYLPPGPVKMGDSWSFEPVFIEQVIGQDLPHVQTTGTLTLESVRKKGGSRIAEIGVVISGTGTGSGEDELGGGANLELSGRLQIDLETFLDRELNLTGRLVTRVQSKDGFLQANLPIEISVAKEWR